MFEIELSVPDRVPCREAAAADVPLAGSAIITLPASLVRFVIDEAFLCLHPARHYYTHHAPRTSLRLPHLHSTVAFTSPLSTLEPVLVGVTFTAALA